MFDTAELTVGNFAESERLVTLDDLYDLNDYPEVDTNPVRDADLRKLATAIKLAKNIPEGGVRRPVILFLGGHVIKNGLSRFIVDLMKRELVTLVAGNGAVAIHDWELSYYGRTSEPVAKYLPTGEFGMWDSMTGFNQTVADFGCDSGLGLGYRLGEAPTFQTSMMEANTDVSILSAGYEYSVPVTIHPLIGGDINCMHHSYDGASFGQAAHVDLIKFTTAVTSLDGGVFINIGSAVHGPEVFLKALSMARNVQDGKPDNFTTAVFDMNNGPAKAWNFGKPTSREVEYYWRPGKTLLSRAVATAGQSLYIEGDFRYSIRRLHQLLVN